MRSNTQKPDFYPWRQGLFTLLFFTGFKTCLVMQVWWPVIYGLGGAATWFGVMTQAEVYMAWSIRSTKDAEDLSKRSGNYTAITENTNLSNDMGDEANGQYSLGLSEKSVPLYRPDQFLQLPDYTAALFYKQNPPIMADLVHYQSVREWQTHALNNPKAVMDGVPVRYSLKS